MGSILTPASLLVYSTNKPRSREQVVVQLRGMYLMIGATLKYEYGQVVVKHKLISKFFKVIYISLENNISSGFQTCLGAEQRDDILL